MRRRPRSHLTANLEARLAELLEIFPVFGIPGVEEGCESVRALGDAELREATRPLNESAHQSCIIKARLVRLAGRRERGAGRGRREVGGGRRWGWRGDSRPLTWVVGHWRLIRTAGLAHFNMLK